jgi:NAD-dependent dihydropyrimidine dehydrogenase PreA subunit
VSIGTVFDDLFTGTTVAIDADRCLDNRHDGAGCRRCVDICPTQAFEVGARTPWLDAQRCVRCGACAVLCPTDAVIDDNPAERRLVDACSELDERGVTLACPVNPRPLSLEWPVVRAGRCLGAVTGDQLLAISGARHRPVVLDLTWCSDCTIGQAADAAIVTVEATNAAVRLATGSAEPLFELRTGAGDDVASLVDGTAPAIVDSWRPSMTRRGMFSALRRRAESAVERGHLAAPVPLRRSRGQVALRLPQSVPASRLRLLERLASLTDATTTPAPTDCEVEATLVPFADVRVDTHRCSGCGLCARYCPTGALHFESSGPVGAEGFALAIRSDLCIDCNICAVACPEAAVEYGDVVTSAMVVGRRWTTLATGPLVKCSACSVATSTVAPAHEPLCFSCRLGAGVVTSLRDDAGLMADLLGRIHPSDSSEGGTS